jgi:hypothetical protein
MIGWRRGGFSLVSLMVCREGSQAGLVAWAQRLARSPPSCASFIGARERERREGAGRGLDQGAGVWGRAAELEGCEALVGGSFG